MEAPLNALIYRRVVYHSGNLQPLGEIEKKMIENYLVARQTHKLFKCLSASVVRK